jgi:hypothetical protein
VNGDRRATGQVCIELIKECAEIGEMSEASHTALTNALRSMVQAEYWSLRNQLPHLGKNPSTDQGIAVSQVALPALEAASAALAADDYDTLVDQLQLAITTDGAKPKRKKK